MLEFYLFLNLKWAKNMGFSKNGFSFGSIGGGGNVVFKGQITQASDFPTLAEVQIGWEYIINNPAGVTDNDPTKTNTGLTFNDQVFILWTGSTWAVESGAVDSYQNSDPTTYAVGGIPAGSTFFSTPKTYSQFAAEAFNKYIPPTFSSFSLQNTAIREVGHIFGENPGDIDNFIWTFTQAANVADNSLNIKGLFLAPAQQLLIANNSKISPASYDFYNIIDYRGAGLHGIVRNTIGTLQFQIDALNTQSGSFLRTFNQSWRAMAYSGANANTVLSNAEILALANKNLVLSPPTSFAFAGGNTRPWYWILSTYQQPVRFRNLGTGFEMGFVGITVPIVQTVTNAYGIAYSYRGYYGDQLLTNAVNIGVEFV